EGKPAGGRQRYFQRHGALDCEPGELPGGVPALGAAGAETQRSGRNGGELVLRIIQSQDPLVEELRQAGQISGQEVLPQVMEIIEREKRDGDQARHEYTERFDGASLRGRGVKVTAAEMEADYAVVTQGFLDALRKAKENIMNFHRRQLEKSWWQVDEAGNILGQLYRPLARVGLYVPGGRAAY